MTKHSIEELVAQCDASVPMSTDEREWMEMKMTKEEKIAEVMGLVDNLIECAKSTEAEDWGGFDSKSFEDIEAKSRDSVESKLRELIKDDE